MRYENNQRLRGYLERGTAGAYRELIRYPRFEVDGSAFAAALGDVRAQHPNLTDDEAQARAVFRLLTMGAPPEIAVALPSPWYRARAWVHRAAPRALPWVKVLWAIGGGGGFRHRHPVSALTNADNVYYVAYVNWG